MWDGAGLGWLAGDAHPEEELLAGPGLGRPAVPGARRGAARSGARAGRAGHRGRARLPAGDRAAAVRRPGSGCCCRTGRARRGWGCKLTARSVVRLVRLGPASQFGLQDLVAFRYDLAVGDEVLSPAELAELARLKVPLVRVRGQWVELDDRHLKAALKFLERRQSGTMTAADVLGPRWARARGLGELPLTAVDADGWLGDLLSGAGRRAAGADGDPGRLPRRAAALPAARACPGCRSSAGSGSARSWPTTWAWARPSSCSRCSGRSESPTSQDGSVRENPALDLRARPC